MTESQYNLIGSERVNGELRLVVHMVEHKSQRDTPIRPMTLHGSENALDEGRFHAFDRSLTDNPVYVGRLSWANIPQGFVNLVEWIAENAEGRWNFHIAHDEKRAACHLTFYFDDVSDAVLFRLSIQNKSV